MNFITNKQVQNDLDKSFIDKEDEQYLSELSTRFNVQEKNEVVKLTGKKKEKLELGGAKIRIRNCLNCYNRFESSGVHNRICDKCRKDAGF